MLSQIFCDIEDNVVDVNIPAPVAPPGSRLPEDLCGAPPALLCALKCFAKKMYGSV